MRHCSLALPEGLNGVNRQLPRGLKFNCQPSEKVIFFTANRQKCRLIFTAKSFKVLQISLCFYGIMAPKESLNCKNQSPCFQKLTLSIQNKNIQLAYNPVVMINKNLNNKNEIIK